MGDPGASGAAGGGRGGCGLEAPGSALPFAISTEASVRSVVTRGPAGFSPEWLDWMAQIPPTAMNTAVKSMMRARRLNALWLPGQPGRRQRANPEGSKSNILRLSRLGPFRWRSPRGVSVLSLPASVGSTLRPQGEYGCRCSAGSPAGYAGSCG